MFDSQGSIQSKFRMRFNDRYKLKAPTEEAYATLIQKDVRTRAPKSALNIKRETIYIGGESFSFTSCKSADVCL